MADIILLIISEVAIGDHLDTSSDENLNTENGE